MRRFDQPGAQRVALDISADRQKTIIVALQGEALEPSPIRRAGPPAVCVRMPPSRCGDARQLAPADLPLWPQ